MNAIPITSRQLPESRPPELQQQQSPTHLLFASLAADEIALGTFKRKNTFRNLQLSTAFDTALNRVITTKMAPARKRGRQEMEAAEAPKEPTLLERIRNMWEFAALNQWIFIFGRAVKIDEDLDIEVSLPTATAPCTSSLIARTYSDILM